MKISNKIFLAIIIIGVVLVVIGAIILGVSLIRSPFTGFAQATIKDPENISETFSQINSVNLKIDAAAVNFFVADTPSVETLNFEKDDIKISYNDETKNLSIFQPDHNYFTEKFRSTNPPESTINLYLPAEFLNSIDIKLDSGDLNLDGFSVNELNLTMDSGDAVITNTSADSSKLEFGAGDVKFNTCNFNNLNIKGGVGDINYNGTLSGRCRIEAAIGDFNLNLSDSSDNYFFVCKIGVGKVTIFDRTFLSMRHQTYGDITAPTQIKIESGVGQLEIKNGV